MVSQKVIKGLQSHAGLDAASSLSSYFWIPAFAGMTEVGLFTTLSLLNVDHDNIVTQKTLLYVVLRTKDVLILPINTKSPISPPHPCLLPTSGGE